MHEDTGYRAWCRFDVLMVRVYTAVKITKLRLSHEMPLQAQRRGGGIVQSHLQVGTGRRWVVAIWKYAIIMSDSWLISMW